jgi:hypothetical protein
VRSKTGSQSPDFPPAAPPSVVLARQQAGLPFPRWIRPKLGGPGRRIFNPIMTKYRKRMKCFGVRRRTHFNGWSYVPIRRINGRSAGRCTGSVQWRADNAFASNGNNPLNFVSRSRGSLQFPPFSTEFCAFSWDGLRADQRPRPQSWRNLPVEARDLVGLGLTTLHHKQPTSAS